MNFKPASRLAGIEKSLIRQIYDRALPGSINLGLGEPDFPTPEIIRAEAVRFINAEKIRYTPNAGLPELRRAIADYHGEAGKHEGVCVTNGAQEALFVTLMAIVNPGDEVLVPDPGFLAYPTLVRMAGGRPVFYKLPAAGQFAFDPEDFKRKAASHPRAIILNSPSNPTGRALTPGDLQFIANVLQGSDAIVISDEIYRELYFNGRPASISDCHPNTLVISGLSKSHAMTGWRLGWVYGDPEIIRHIIVMHQYTTTCAPAISQHAALAAFTAEGRAAGEKLRRDLRARRDFMIAAIDQEFAELRPKMITPEGAFYLMLETPGPGDSKETAERLLQHKVITIPGAAFGEEAEGYLRLSFAGEFETIREGISRIRRGATFMSRQQLAT